MKDIGNSSNFTEEEELFLLRNKQGKIVGIKDLKQANFQETMKDWKKHLPKPSLLSIIIWVAVALLGGLAWSLIALAQGETINAIWFVIAAVCSYLIGYRFYALYIQRKIMRPMTEKNSTQPIELFYSVTILLQLLELGLWLDQF